MLAAVVALALGETALAKGMKQTARAGGEWTAQALAVVRNGWIAAGVVLLGVHLVLYMLALRRADLSFALPLTAASYPLSALLARFYLREDVGTARWIGTLLITAGVAIVALGEATRRSLARRGTRPGAIALGAGRQLRLHQVEQVADALDPRQLLGRQPHPVLSLDPHHQPDHVHRVEVQRLAEVLVVGQGRVGFAHLLFQQADERRP